MNNPTSSYVLLFVLLIFTCLCETIAKADEANAKLYIVYLGHKPHDDHELITDSHHDILGQVIGSKEKAKKHMVYSYRHGFSGFAAKLTHSQAEQIAELPDVISVIQNPIYTTHTSRSWDFLGLPQNNPNSLLNKTNQGDGIIVGIIDSGIYADSEAFNDKGLGPIPSRWKGRCKSEGIFDATKHCNKKIIGARWYIKGLMAEAGLNETMAENLFNLSPLDEGGHGTHVAYTVAGSDVNNVQYHGLNMGNARGGAPLARLAIYKVCWDGKAGRGGCGGADMLAAIDDAIKDGVDIISASVGRKGRVFSEVDFYSTLGIGSFHAVSNGIPFVTAGGNSGPETSSIHNVSPWMITVAAVNDDRDIVTPLTLGNNKTILTSEEHFKGKDQGFVPLLVARDVSNTSEIEANANEVKGKVLVLFLENRDIGKYMLALNTTGVLALIAVTSPYGQPLDFNKMIGVPIPFFAVDVEQGNHILDYFQQCKSNNQEPMIKLGQSEILQGNEISLKVAKFSSRGPNSFAPEILKPDVAAPGVGILAAAPPRFGDNGFQLLGGTSMATPHVSGIVALLKVAHPDWSPAAIKSALVTTAWNEDTYRPGIYSEGTGDHLATPFDIGGGICNSNGATDPGLIYDMDKNDYLNYLCSLGYNNDMVRNATAYFFDKKNSTICPKEVPSRLDLNLPSISIPSLKNSIIVKRTVTNVGNVNAIYKLVVKPPRNTAITVSPNVLKFSSKIKKISFEVKIISTYQRRSKFDFGSLAWTDGKHFVRIPIAVRT